MIRNFENSEVKIYFSNECLDKINSMYRLTNCNISELYQISRLTSKYEKGPSAQTSLHNLLSLVKKFSNFDSPELSIKLPNESREATRLKNLVEAISSVFLPNSKVAISKNEITISKNETKFQNQKSE